MHVSQDLTITVTTEKSESEISLEEDESEVCGINVQSFMAEQEWRLHNHVETWKKVTTKVFQNTKFKHPALAAACKASRRPGFFIWNVFFVMVSFMDLSCTCFLFQFKTHLFALLKCGVSEKELMNLQCVAGSSPWHGITYHYDTKSDPVDQVENGLGHVIMGIDVMASSRSTPLLYTPIRRSHSDWYDDIISSRTVE